jgi:hypothetical protein
MKTRRDCEKQFRPNREDYILKKLLKKKPKLVIQYGGKRMGDNLKWRNSPLIGQWKFSWIQMNNRKTLFVHINHVSRMSYKILMSVADKTIDHF